MTAEPVNANINQEYLKAALRLLKSEKSTEKPNRRKLFFKLLSSLFIGSLVNTLLTGLIIIWFDAVVGRNLLIIAGVSLLIGAVLVVIEALGEKTEDESENKSVLGRLAGEVFEEANEATQVVGGIIAIGWLTGIGLLIRSLVTTREPSGLALGLTFLYLLFSVMIGFEEYRKQRYISRMFHLHNRLEERLQEVETRATSGYDINDKESSFLARIEEKRVARAIRELPKRRRSTYSIRIIDDANTYLSNLPVAERSAIYKLIDALQTEPQPAQALSVPGKPDTFTLNSQSGTIFYSVDQEKRVISVTEIHPVIDPEVSHGS